MSILPSAGEVKDLYTALCLVHSIFYYTVCFFKGKLSILHCGIQYNCISLCIPYVQKIKHGSVHNI